MAVHTTETISRTISFPATKTKFNSEVKLNAIIDSTVITELFTAGTCITILF